MNKKIFHSNLIITFSVLTVSITLIICVLFNYFEKQIQNELKNEANYVSYAIEKQGVSYIENFKNNNKRITLISSDGKVIADTSVDINSLDNHSDRKEIIDAISNGSGISIRYSDTLTQETIYYALKLNDGNILRISTTQHSVVALILELVKPLSAVIIITLVISFLISKKVSESIVKPINELNLDNPSNNETYEELTPLLNKLVSQKHTINKQLKLAQKKQEEFRLITENMNEGFLVIDNQTNLLTYNQAALKLLEIDEIKAGSVLMLNRTKGFRDSIEKALKGERAERNITLDEHNYSLIANPTFEDDKIIGAVIIIFDVTERIKGEQLRQEFTSNVSHELKTPLTSISGFAEIMKAGGVSEDIVIDFSKSIYEEAQRLINLVNDIIKISEFDEKSIQFKTEKVDLYEISKNVIQHLRPMADKRLIELSLIGDRVCIYGVKSIIEEMIYNLCDNAIKYNKDNGRVNIILNDTKTKAKVIVTDTGIGIPLTVQDRVFERFYRVDKSHSKAIGGTGLGLSIVKHGAIYHNAEINLKSTENKGTTITISFKKN